MTVATKQQEAANTAWLGFIQGVTRRGERIVKQRRVKCGCFPEYWEIQTSGGARYMLRHVPVEPYYKITRMCGGRK